MAHPSSGNLNLPNYPRTLLSFILISFQKADQYVTQRPPQIQISIQHVVRPQVNQPSRVRNQNRRTNADEDDDLGKVLNHPKFIKLDYGFFIKS